MRRGSGTSWQPDLIPGPELLEPDVSVHRLTASGNSFLLESSLDVDGRHVVFGRAEYIQKAGQELLLPEPLADSLFGVGALALGYVYNLGAFGPVRPGHR